jgi:hypothetical protein
MSIKKSPDAGSVATSFAAVIAMVAAAFAVSVVAPTSGWASDVARDTVASYSPAPIGVTIPTDVSAARRRHGTAATAAVRRSYGGTVESAVVGAGAQGFGYGVNDNSRDKTW